MHKLLLILFSLFLLADACAQVRTSAEAFPVRTAAQPLPVRPYQPAAPAPVIAAPPLLAASSASPTRVVIRQGESIDDQLRAYAQPAGWDLVWEAGPYVVDRELVMPGDFEAAIASLLQGVNASGIHLRAVFYRGNRTVRVWEE